MTYYSLRVHEVINETADAKSNFKRSEEGYRLS